MKFSGMKEFEWNFPNENDIIGYMYFDNLLAMNNQFCLHFKIIIIISIPIKNICFWTGSSYKL